jgi:putative FmdB family regulatory protein
MPTYEYACNSCGEHLEVVQSFRDQPLTSCPVCGGPLRKVFGSIGIVFKGSGFYKTDSRGTSTKEKTDKADKADKKEETGTSGEAGTKSAEASKSSASDTAGSGSSGSSGSGDKNTSSTKTAPSAAAVS